MGFEYSFVWKSSFGLESLETWFRTLYIMYGLGLGTPKLISCRVELRRALRLLDMFFFLEGSSYKLNQEHSLFSIIFSSRILEWVFGSEIQSIQK